MGLRDAAVGEERKRSQDQQAHDSREIVDLEHSTIIATPAEWRVIRDAAIRDFYSKIGTPAGDKAWSELWALCGLRHGLAWGQISG